MQTELRHSIFITDDSDYEFFAKVVQKQGHRTDNLINNYLIEIR